MLEITLQIEFDEELGFSYYNVPCVPQVGERISCTSTRDDNGNYDPRGRVIRRAAGRVVSRAFSFEQRGKSSASYRTGMYVMIRATSKGATPRRLLTTRQSEALQAIIDYQEEYGYPPTYRDLMAALGIKSPRGVGWLLDKLEQRGWITRDGTARGIQVIK